MIPNSSVFPINGEMEIHVMEIFVFKSSNDFLALIEGKTPDFYRDFERENVD
jgi:hypothetical protein